MPLKRAALPDHPPSSYMSLIFIRHCGHLDTSEQHSLHSGRCPQGTSRTCASLSRHTLHRHSAFTDMAPSADSPVDFFESLKNNRRLLVYRRHYPSHRKKQKQKNRRLLVCPRHYSSLRKNRRLLVCRRHYPSL